MVASGTVIRVVPTNDLQARIKELEEQGHKDRERINELGRQVTNLARHARTTEEQLRRERRQWAKTEVELAAAYQETITTLVREMNVDSTRNSERRRSLISQISSATLDEEESGMEEAAAVEPSTSDAMTTSHFRVVACA